MLSVYGFIASLRDVLALIGFGTVIYWTVKITVRANRIRLRRRRVG